MSLQFTTPILYRVTVSFLSATHVGEAVMFALNETRGLMIFEYIHTSEGPCLDEALTCDVECKYQGF